MSSRRAPRPVPAPWLGNKAGECAISVGDCGTEKGKTFSSKTTSLEI
jgi:hypothetical protein